jgi:predicted nucleic acid-binding Zn ribbon protein
LPTYRFEDTSTGEIFEKWMLMDEKPAYLIENPHLKPLIPTQMNVGESGFWQDKLRQKHPSWNEVLAKASKSGGSKSQIGKI